MKRSIIYVRFTIDGQIDKILKRSIIELSELILGKYFVCLQRIVISDLFRECSIYRSKAALCICILLSDTYMILIQSTSCSNFNAFVFDSSSCTSGLIVSDRFVPGLISLNLANSSIRIAIKRSAVPAVPETDGGLRRGAI